MGGLPAVFLPGLRAVELPRHQPPVPSEDGLGFDDSNGVGHQLAQGNGFLSEDSTFGIGEQNAFPDLVAKDSVLLDQVLNSG